MNICEVKNLVVGASYEKKIEVLENLYSYSGDCVMNGYLGSSVLNISYDKETIIENIKCIKLVYKLILK